MLATNTLLLTPKQVALMNDQFDRIRNMALFELTAPILSKSFYAIRNMTPVELIAVLVEFRKPLMDAAYQVIYHFIFVGDASGMLLFLAMFIILPTICIFQAIWDECNNEVADNPAD